MKTVDELMADAFGTPRTPRSSEYKAGVRSILDYRINSVKPECPYKTGSAAADAYFSGQDEGHRRWREMQCG